MSGGRRPDAVTEGEAWAVLPRGALDAPPEAPTSLPAPGLSLADPVQTLAVWEQRRPGWLSALLEQKSLCVVS